MKKQNGITLIALVITIIILLILAGITLSLTLGENGLLRRADESKRAHEQGEQNDIVAMNEATDYMNKFFGESPEIPKEPEKSPEPEGGGKSFNPRYGVIEVKFLQKDTYYFAEQANAPKIDESKGMKLIKFDDATKQWVDGVEYSYEASSGAKDEKKSKWANAKVTVGGIDSYFVWIPRYAYKITYFDTKAHRDAYRADRTQTTGLVGYSDSRGLVDYEGKKIDGIPSYTSINCGDYYAVHPAFTADAEMGGGFGELEGIWIGKYEASGTSSTATSAGTSGVKVVPGVKGTASRYTLIKDMYNNAKSYKSDLYSHMLKNSEWGVVAYLADSAYGRNGTLIGVNRCNDYITGAGPGIDDAKYDYNADNFETDYCYYTEQGMKASTTGNVYGIYDMSGGVLECVACYYKGSETTDVYTKGSSFASKNGVSNEYATAYTASYIRGDDLYETNDWNTESSAIVSASQVFQARGGHAKASITWQTGLFYSNANDGGVALNQNAGYRIGIIVK